jgi:hypothetical protein
MTKRREELAGLKARFRATQGNDGPCAWCGSEHFTRKRLPGGIYCTAPAACAKRRSLNDRAAARVPVRIHGLGVERVEYDPHARRQRALETERALGLPEHGPLCLCPACLLERERAGAFEPWREREAKRGVAGVFTGRECPACKWNERAPEKQRCEVCRAPMTLEGLQAENDAARARIDRELDAPRRVPSMTLAQAQAADARDAAWKRRRK